MSKCNWAWWECCVAFCVLLLSGQLKSACVAVAYTRKDAITFAVTLCATEMLSRVTAHSVLQWLPLWFFFGLYCHIWAIRLGPIGMARPSAISVKNICCCHICRYVLHKIFLLGPVQNCHVRGLQAPALGQKLRCIWVCEEREWFELSEKFYFRMTQISSVCTCTCPRFCSEDRGMKSNKFSISSKSTMHKNLTIFYS